MEAARERGRTRVPIRCGAQVPTVLLVNASWSPGQTAACVLGVSAVSVRSFSFHPLLRHRTYTEHVGRGSTSPSVQWRWPVYPLHKSQPCQGPSIYVHAEFRVMATIGTHMRKCQISSFVLCVCVCVFLFHTFRYSQLQRRRPPQRLNCNSRRKPFVRMHGLVYSLQAQRDYMNMHK